MTEMRPDPDSDLAGSVSEYGDDTGFAAEATRTSPGDTSGDTTDGSDAPDGSAGSPGDAGDAGDAAEETDAAVDEPGPGAGGD